MWSIVSLISWVYFGAFTPCDGRDLIFTPSMITLPGERDRVTHCLDRVSLLNWFLCKRDDFVHFFLSWNSFYPSHTARAFRNCHFVHGHTEGDCLSSLAFAPIRVVLAKTPLLPTNVRCGFRNFSLCQPTNAVYNITYVLTHTILVLCKL